MLGVYMVFRLWQRSHVSIRFHLKTVLGHGHQPVHYLPGDAPLLNVQAVPVH